MKKILLIILSVFAVTTSFSSVLINEVKDYYKEEEYIKIITILEATEELNPELTYYLAESYLNSIKDAASWMKYNSKYQETIVKCLANDPKNVDYLLNSAKGMMWFPSERGGKNEGVKLLLSLEESYPNHSEVIFTTANYRYGDGLIKEAKIGYLKVLEITPNHKGAKRVLDIIKTDKMELTIRNINFIGNSKTSSKALLKKISNFKGSILNRETRTEITSKLIQKPGINGASISAKKTDDIYVDLEINIAEEKTKILMFQQVSGVGMDYDSDLIPSGLMPPVTVYIDNNFLGTGSNLMLISVFVYNQLALTVPGLIDDKYLDFKLDMKSMLLSSENSTFVNGILTDGTKKNSSHSIKAGLGRSFPFNLSAFLYYQAGFDIHEKLRENIKPNHLITHSVTGEVIFNSSGSAETPFTLQDGLLFQFIPTMNYKQDYKPWGDPRSLITHNDNVSLRFLTQFGYYKNLNPKNNLSLLTTWMINHNPYETDRFALGHKGDATTKNSITGYLPGEIRFNNGLLLNTKYTFTPKANKINIYGKYDLLFDIENLDIYNGIGVGSAVKLPWDLNLKGEIGIGLNAHRNSGIGYFISLELTKLMIF